MTRSKPVVYMLYDADKPLLNEISEPFVTFTLQKAEEAIENASSLWELDDTKHLRIVPLYH